MKNRLFVFGDSWANNYFSKENKYGQNGVLFLGSTEVKRYVNHYNYFGHWIDHMENFYDVISFGEGGVSNENIIYQLSNLPNYQEGDRIIIILTTAERFSWVHGNTPYSFVANGVIMSELYSNKHYLEFIDRQFVERHNLWMSDKYTNEKRFLDSLSTIYQKWNPIVVTWVHAVYQKLNNVEFIDMNEKFTNISEESWNQCRDWHLGVRGNYELFKYFSKKLNLDTTKYIFEPEEYPRSLL